MEFSPANSFNDKYLDKANTTAINGIFVILVVFSHYAQYADLGGIYDKPYLIMREHLNQMVVATFMFYSGYGMMEAIKRKGESYMGRLVTKFWKLLLKFDFAVILFILVSTILGIKYPLMHTLLAFTTWTAVGNSNWYITAILLLYIILFISFKIGFRIGKEGFGRSIGILFAYLLTIACVWMQMKAGRPGYCYNTMILLPTGCLYSEIRQSVDHWITKDDSRYCLVVMMTIGIYILSYFRRWKGGIECFTVWAVAFMLLVLLATMKIKIYNGFLEWFGKHVFSIYILQRIPMMILYHFGCIQTHKYMSLIVSIAVTAYIALIFERVSDRLIVKKGAK